LRCALDIGVHQFLEFFNGVGFSLLAVLQNFLKVINGGFLILIPD